MFISLKYFFPFEKIIKIKKLDLYGKIYKYQYIEIIIITDTYNDIYNIYSNKYLTFYNSNKLIPKLEINRNYMIKGSGFIPKRIYDIKEV